MPTSVFYDFWKVKVLLMKCEVINFKLFKYHQKVMLQVKLNEMHRAEEKVCCISLKMVSDMMLYKYSGCLEI